MPNYFDSYNEILRNLTDNGTLTPEERAERSRLQELREQERRYRERIAERNTFTVSDFYWDENYSVKVKSAEEDMSKEKSVECGKCTIRKHKRDTTKVKTGRNTYESWCYICVDNCRVCQHCDYRVSDKFWSQYSRYYCIGCFSQLMTRCSYCKDLIDKSPRNRCQNKNTFIDNGIYLCEECKRENKLVKSHNFNVTTVLGADNGKRLFGVELEVGSNMYDASFKTMARTTYDLVKKDAILVHDGTIHTGDYDGFEIVTRPMTFSNQIKFWNNFLRVRHKNLRSYDLGTCGLHVHVTKKSLSNLTIGKLNNFLNAGENATLIRKIAQRYNDDYAKQEAKKKISQPFTNRDKYNTLNISPKYTVEFRLFKGTLNMVRFMACLEFTESLIRYCENASFNELTSQSYREFVKTEPKLNNLKRILRLAKLPTKRVQKYVGKPKSIVNS